MTKKLNQRGFGLIEGLLIVLIVLVSGGIGYYVWNANQSDDKTVSTTKTTQSDKSTEAKADDTVSDITYSKAPEALQAAILATTKSMAPACVKDGSIVDFNGKAYDQEINYIASGFAYTDIGCDGGQAYLFVESGGAWVVADHGQMGFECGILDKYKVPVSLLEHVISDGSPVKCFGTDGKLQDYTGYK